ncbi:hypothetical protein B0H10DRAFT_1982024 [Mycena sp. CBHHK59/15]|nr:hypothetical protein B0H10DRAFT_1982024 [Mycena sp. CBHHK59/15]
MSSIVYYGPVVSPVSLKTFKALPSCLIAVGPLGNIDWIVEDVADDSMVQDIMAAHDYIDVAVVCLRNGEFIMPGFIDTHTHAPQVPNLGTGQQYELLDWLESITFPMESKYSDVDFAQRTYASVVRRIIDSGTTTCCYYGTIHLEATKALADIVHGCECNMDRNSPSHYIEPSAEPLVQPILTPRFAITCTSSLLTSLGALAASDPNLRIQTHISENPTEVDFTMSLFPGCSSYAGVYDSFGLLRSNTILAHAVHLNDEEISLVAERKAGISHCPTSNFNLNSGVAKIGQYLDRGIKVGLGTDVSGGYSPSILNAIRSASIASKVIAMQHRGDPPEPAGFSNKQLLVASLLYLATLGGAELFDALVVNVRNDAGNPALNLEGMLEQFFYCGDDRNISGVYVQGKLIGGTSFTR